jgi:3-dehydroquinate synthase
VAGFVAATFLRGIPAVYVPTTVLGAVDASIGGKTAVNVGGKNLAGSFTHPVRVLVDIETLETTPAHLRVQGAAEALKTGFIADMGIVELFEAAPTFPDLEEVVNRSIAVKTSVVSEDFREGGRRAILNYGHTTGHAVEALLGISHGEAVSIGMVAAGAASSHATGFGGADRQREVLHAVGLPTTLPNLVPSLAVRSVMAKDKKRAQDQLRMVLLEEFESPVVVAVDDATVAAGLAAIGIGE